MIGVIGGGAFGTALAIALARDRRSVILWSRRAESPAEHLPGVDFPQDLRIVTDLDALDRADPVLLALPMQALGGFLGGNRDRLDRRTLVLCCKGIDLATGRGPTSLAADLCPAARFAVVTGPGFASDIARGLPTALTLAAADGALGKTLQTRLSTRSLRLYRSDDVIGAELGGALKNVIAIAAGITIGAGLGQSARAALMTRGYAEMVRFARSFGARAETLAGLSGLGDLVLTCTSDQSRNFRFGRALGAGEASDVTGTVEGAATALATIRLARGRGIEMPVAEMVASLVDRSIQLEAAIEALLNRPLKEE